MATDSEKYFAADEARLVEGNSPGVVGDEPQVVHRYQFDKRDAVAGRRIEDADFGICDGLGLIGRSAASVLTSGMMASEMWAQMDRR